MKSFAIKLITILLSIGAKHVIYGDYGCGYSTNNCNYECFGFCVQKGYGSGGCYGNKCMCAWDVINETLAHFQSLNGNNFNNNPNNFNANNNPGNRPVNIPNNAVNIPNNPNNIPNNPNNPNANQPNNFPNHPAG